MDRRQVVREGYDEITDAYDEKRTAEGRERELAAAFGADLNPGARVLDAGCGGGRPVVETLAEHHHVVGLDISTAQLELARQRVPDARFLQGDLAALPFDDDAFDGVAAYHSVIHVPKEEHADVLGEFHRVLRPGGRLIVSMGTAPFEDEEDDWLDTGTTMAWSIHGPEKNRQLLSAAGFDIERVEAVEDELDGVFDFYHARASHRSSSW